MSDQTNVQERLINVEDRLGRLENLLVSINEKLEQTQQPTVAESEDTEKFQQWVTDYVSMRLQQLVPETCDHPAETPMHDGPFLDNTNVPCTEEVVHRVKRIPIPFVREMVVQRVAENARNAKIERVDIEFFEQAATF
ncbi:hypothetical protein F4X73_11605 [Candidatus Poribacteria bacterium]|nr:hypothetical protein [Candidatus Poribacteria bacterium]MYB65326.1 hypothetical protein [Candidatus Poribacteria bacterium]